MEIHRLAEAYLIGTHCLLVLTGWPSLPARRGTASREYGARKPARLVILLEVLILYIISLVCFVALIGVGVAMVRHVRAGHRQEHAAAPPAPAFKEHLQSAVKYGSIRDLRQVHHQRVESITARKEWNAPSQAVEIHPSADDAITAGRKKTPQASSGHRQISGERVDWSHFNKDYGDLTDPHPSRPTRAAADRTASGRRS